MIRVLNPRDLTHLLESLPRASGRKEFLDAFSSRYPKFKWTASRKCYGGYGLVTKDLERVAEVYHLWVNAEYEAAGNNARAVWQKHLNSALILTQWVGEREVFTWSFGPGPEDFIQIEVSILREQTDRPPFDPEWEPEDLRDLRSGSCSFLSTDEVVFLPARFKLDRVLNVKRFAEEMAAAERFRREAQLPTLRKKTLTYGEIYTGSNAPPSPPPQKIPFLEMNPDYLTRPLPEQRLFQDWAESSPGKAGEAFGSHWFLEPHDYENSIGRHVGFIPQWADLDGGNSLPKLHGEAFNSVHGLMAELEAFDRQTGYPFNWYFYGLHGNRVDHNALHLVADAVRSGRIGLPRHDAEVLLRWDQVGYGF